MNNSGAIPKFKGGARPKTKAPISSVNAMATDLSNSYLNNKDFSCDEPLINEYNPERNKYKRQSCSSNLNANHLSSTDNVLKTSGIPLEKREILIADNGVQMKKPALSPAWVEDRLFLHYIRPPLHEIDETFVEGATDAWLEQMEFLVDDLHWLLSLPHHRFWSQVVHDRSVHECIETYLERGPRWYDNPVLLNQPDSCITLVINKIHQAVFRIYLRLSTYKESKDDFITSTTFADLIYNNFLFDICKCLDLCVLYGATNQPLLHKMINNIFTVQPKYYDDLAQLVETLKSVHDTLEHKLGIYDVTLPRAVHPESQILDLTELQDIVRYLQDTFCSLHAFLSIYPEAAITFHEKEFPLRLSVFYEKVTRKLLELLVLDEEDEEEELVKSEIRRDLTMARSNALAVFRDILAWSCLQPDTRSPSPGPLAVCGPDAISRGVESFTHLLTSCLEDKVFITDYNSAFGLDTDIAYFAEKGSDMTHLNFVKEAVECVVAEMNLSSEAPANGQLPTVSPGESSSDKVEDSSGMNGYYAGETAPARSPGEITSLIFSIQDLLPDLGDGFVRAVLRYYNYSLEDSLNALLEGVLPPPLDALDRSLKESEAESRLQVEQTPQEQTSSPAGDSSKKEEDWETSDPLCNRLNVYDDDEFDVFRRPAALDKTRVHRGKAQDLDPGRRGFEKDPELAAKMKRILHEYEANAGYSIYEDEEKYSPTIAIASSASTSADYNDEYDDTYDDDEMGEVGGGLLDDKDFRRRGASHSFISLRGRGALNTPGLSFAEEDGEQETEEESSELNEEGSKESKFKKANARIYTNWTSASRPTQGSIPSLMVRNSGRAYPKEEGDEQTAPRRPTSFEPFCEDPEETRRRIERKKTALRNRNKGWCPEGPRDEGPPKFATKSTRHSGKSWRQGTPGTGGDDPEHRTQGGKYKENTNHGKAQDRNYRHKMIHKNEQRRNAAQAKYRNNF